MSQTAAETIEHAQFTSITENRTITLSWSQELEDELRAQADDSAENGNVMEFWGDAESDDPAAPGVRPWRIHLERPEAE